MVSVGLLIRLQARPEQERAVEDFLTGVIPIIEREPETIALFALRLGPTEYGIFNAFPDEAGRQAHISGDAAAALFAAAGDLFASPPAVEPVDILASKLPVAAVRA
jgi:quinol monooxygenase YgiN